MTIEDAAELLSEVTVLDDPEMAEAHRVAISALRQQDVTDTNVGKMTNADRIRAMSDEELATFISEIADECERNTECNQHCYGCDIEYCVRESCLNWLQQPAEEADHD